MLLGKECKNQKQSLPSTKGRSLPSSVIFCCRKNRKIMNIKELSFSHVSLQFWFVVSNERYVQTASAV